MSHRAPARGVLAGIKADAERAKGTGETYNPQGHGSAWSHNFLNQKPWHPLNFRNQAKVWEAEQAAIKATKDKDQAKAEFEAEQEYLKSLSYLSSEEQKKYAERQSISFIYMKPPGYDAAQQRVEPKPATTDDTAGAPGLDTAAKGPAGNGGDDTKREARRAAPASGHLANMLSAMAALHQQERFEVKHVSGMGKRSPPRGGADMDAANQQILADATDSDDTPGNGGEQPEATKRIAKRQRLEDAHAFLQAAGLDVQAIAAELANTKGKRSKDKKHKHKKHKHKPKKNR